MLLPVSGATAELALVVPDVGGIPDGAELSSFCNVSEETPAGSDPLVCAIIFALFAFVASPAFLAASKPAWRIAVVKGLSVVEEGGRRDGVSVDVGAFDGVVVGVEVIAGGLDGVFDADGVGVEGAPGAGPSFSLSSPYSFHSSTSSRSYSCS